MDVTPDPLGGSVERWEYRVEESKDGLRVGQLDSLGRHGWRLVSEVVIEDPHKGRTVRATFERRRD